MSKDTTSQTAPFHSEEKPIQAEFRCASFWDSFPRAMILVHREDITTLRSVIIDGHEHNLGILKDFRKHPNLAAFIPDQARLSMSWVHLEPGEILESHVHPTGSMIITAHGEGETLGQLNVPFEDGDVILIPPGVLHGFKGLGDRGFWALSIQFEGSGLYENPSHARARFEDSIPSPDTGASDLEFRQLLSRNRQFAEDHLKNPIFEIVSSTRLEEKRHRDRFYDCVQIWSECFQRALLARSALAEDRRYAALFSQHLTEEFGHDAKLARDRSGSLTPVWDPVLDSASHWFAWKMVSLDNVEKLVLVHLVLEVGSYLISNHARQRFAAFQETDFFEVHAAADEGHQEAGLDLLKTKDTATYERLFQVQQEGWDMLNLLCSRIAALADN
jgi:quercetin dioxygenase-like cupin family protein